VGHQFAIVGTAAINNVAGPDAEIVRHDTEVDACGGADPLADVSHLLRFGLRRRGKFSPRWVGRSIGSQIDPAASPLLNIWCDVVPTL
jgi:hypothetical protein